jgi:hypothetical protein
MQGTGVARIPMTTRVHNAGRVALLVGHARRSLGRAIAALVVFVLWLFVSWIGPDYQPAGGWSLPAAIGALAGYSVLTVIALGIVFRGAYEIVTRGDLRSVVRRNVGPVSLVVLIALGAALTIAFVHADMLIGAVLGAATGLAIIVASYALARAVHLQRLRVRAASALRA